jgi:hypothetical protein
MQDRNWAAEVCEGSGTWPAGDTANAR